MTEEGRKFFKMLKHSDRRSLQRTGIAIVLAAIAIRIVIPVFTDVSPQPKRGSTERHRTEHKTDPTKGPEPPSPVRAEIDVSPVTAVPAWFPEPVTKVAEQTTVVAVVMGERLSFGTGVIIKDGLILTAAHVFWNPVGDIPPLIEVFCDGVPRPAIVLRRSDLRDVALLSAPDCVGTELEFEETEPEEGRRLFALGYEFNDRITDAYRFWRRTQPIDRDEECARARRRVGLTALSARPNLPHVAFHAVDGALHRGNSGSPIVDVHGRIVGIFVIWDEDDDFSCYVPTEEILQVIIAP